MNYAIIAAGEGSRLVQEGVTYPKPLVPLDGRPMIGRLIDIFMQCNPESLTVIVNEQMTAVADWLRQRAATLPVRLNLVVKSTPSSMHSFYEVSRHMAGTGGKLVLTTVDTIFRPEDFEAYVRAYEADTEGTYDAFMGVTSFIDDEKPLYIDVDSNMDITAFRDKPFEGVRYISGGIYGLGPRAVGLLQQCIDGGVSRMRNYQRALIEAGLRVHAWPFGKIVDVDHAGDIATARAFLRGED